MGESLSLVVVARHIMTKMVALVAMCFSIGCSSPRPESGQPPKIHPKVFSMVECWLSDTTEPVATEINLDAVRRNGNQFYGSIFADGAWVTVLWEKGHGFMRYRVLSSQGNAYVVEFQNNGGGTLTTSSRIGFTLTDRTVDVDGERRRVQIMRIESIQRVGDESPSGDGNTRVPDEWIDDPVVRYGGDCLELYRLFADFNGDGIEDMALCDGVGHAGGEFTIYVRNTQGKYRKLGKFFALPNAVALEKLEDHVRLWTYVREPGSGEIGYFEVRYYGVSEFNSLPIYAGDSGSQIANAIYKAVMENSDFPVKVERLK